METKIQKYFTYAFRGNQVNNFAYFLCTFDILKSTFYRFISDFDAIFFKICFVQITTFTSNAVLMLYIILTVGLVKKYFR